MLLMSLGGTVMVEVALNSFVMIGVGNGMPNPSSRNDDAINFLSLSLIAGMPVISGNRWHLLYIGNGTRNPLSLSSSG